MSQKKRLIRSNFREAVFSRDEYRCRMCGSTERLDAHHIVDRTLLPNGGYVASNGISLCPKCHVLAEKYHSTGIPHPHYSPAELYGVINSSYEKAYRESLKTC